MTGTPHSIDDLLRHSDWVRGLAHSLAGDGAEADELVQETWLAALRRPPRSAHNLRAWFAQLVRNFARQRARGEQRRRRREALASRAEALPSAAALVERADLQRRIVEVVLALDEPARTLVLLRHFEGMPPAEIARRQGVPLETVRTRLRRALARLRVELDRTHGGGREALAPLAVPMALGERAAWRGVAAELCAAPAGALLLLSANAKLAAVATVCVLSFVGLGILVLGAGGPTPSPLPGAPLDAGPGQRSAAAGDRSGGAAERDAAAVGRGEASRRTVDTAAGGAAVLLRTVYGRLLGVRLEVPFSTPLRIDGLGEGHADRGAVVRADGTFSFRVADPVARDPDTAFAIVVDDPRYMPERRAVDAAELAANTTATPIVVTVRCASIVTGRVVDADGNGLQSCLVTAHALRDGVPVSEPVDDDRNRPDGTFLVRVPLDGECLLAACRLDARFDPRLDIDFEPAFDCGGSSSLTVTPRFVRNAEPAFELLPAAVRVTAITGREVEAPPIVLRPGLDVEGRVLWADGSPVPGASLEATGRPSSPVRLLMESHDVRWWPDDVLALDNPTCETGADGTFRLTGLPAKPCIVEVKWVAGHLVRVGEQRTTVVPPQRADFVLGGARLDLEVTDGARRIEAAVVSVDRDGETLRSSTDHGVIALVVEPDREHVVRVTAAGYEPVRFSWRPARAGGREHRVVVLSAATAREVSIRLLCDEPIRHARFKWGPIAGIGAGEGTGEADSGREGREYELEAEGGAFSFENLAPGRYQVLVRRPYHPAHRLEEFFVGTETEVAVPAAGRVEHEVRVVVGGALEVRAATPAGVYVTGTCRVLDRAGRAFPLAFQVDEPGGYVMGGIGDIVPRGVNRGDRPLPPGDYDVVLEPDGGGAELRERVSIVPGESARVEFVTR